MNIAYQRLQNQHITQPVFEHPEAVVRWMGGMQAQDYHQALWAVASRLPATTMTEVEQSIADGKIVRTWLMRGTIHFVAPEDAKWIIALTAERIMAKDKRRLEQLELDQATLDRCLTLFYDALHGGKSLTRAEMMQVLENAGISTKGQRGYHILWHAAHRMLICSGATVDKEQTFVLFDEWIPHSRSLEREAALVELARRYFASHAPATVQDFAWWTGLTLTDARIGLAGAKDKLVAAKINGKEYWITGESSPPNAANTFLLAGFDEYLLGYTDRSDVLPPQHAAKVCPGGNGVFFPMIVRNGQIVGTWKRAIKKEQVVITHEPFTSFTAAEKAQFEAAAQRYGTFLGLSVVFE